MKVVILIPNIEHYKYFFSGVKEIPQARVVPLGKGFSLVKKIENFFKLKDNKLLYYLCYLLLRIRLNLKKFDVVVLTDLAQKKLPKGFVNWLRYKNKNKRFIMMFYNKISTLLNQNGNDDIDIIPNRYEQLPYNNIFSYDFDEAKRFGFEYYVVLSDNRRFLNNNVPKQTLSDIFYVGSVGAQWKMGRYYEVDRLYNYLKSKQIICDFLLVFDRSIIKPDCPYSSYEKVSYKQMINKEVSSRIILDIVSDNKNGVSARFYDALMYNKKYLTNNKEILSHPYYNPQYMRVYSELEDIDIEWIKSDEEVDYHYDGYYSPQGFYNKLLNMVEYSELMK